MTKKKEFSILKWIIFPLNSVLLAGVIAWFNLRVFGWDDGLPYCLIVALIGIFGIIINKYTESENRTLARATFVFEIILTAALIGNAAWSLSVQREMSVARMGEQSQKETIGEISKLKGSKTQREALKKIDKKESAAGVFARYEQTLFWIMVGELALYGLSAFTLFALAKLMDDPAPAKAPQTSHQNASYLAVGGSQGDFPSELDTERADFRQGPRIAKFDGQKFDDEVDGESVWDYDKFPTRFHKDRQAHLSVEPEVSRLRDALKEVSYYMPKTGFKADRSGDGIIVRQFSYDGEEKTVHSAKLSDAECVELIALPVARRFRALSERGFAVYSQVRTFVYFIRRKGTDIVKIGMSDNPGARLKGLQTASDAPLELVKALPGTEGLEKRLHAHFANRHLTGEWFQLTQEDIDNVVAKIEKRLASGKRL